MQKNPYLVKVEILVRPGAGGSQAMWAAYRCPISGRVRSVWGSVKTTAGDTPILTPGFKYTHTLVFGSGKDAGNKSAVADMYDKKFKKYEVLGSYDLDVSSLQATPVTATPAATQPTAPQAPLAKSAARALPKSLTHPEKMKANSPSAGWFF
jgi:hypothetical protein